MKVKHTRDAEVRLNRAKALISGTVQTVDTLKEKLDIPAQRQLTRDVYKDSLERIFPKPAEKTSTTRWENLLHDVTALFESNDRNAFPEYRGTGFNLLQAITEYTNHLRGTRITTGRSRYTQDMARAESALFGTSSTLKENALDILLESTANCQTKPYKT